ncbi:MAG: hypothetical protein E2O38_00800 [Proteobacteria bacterium]|nr:MAG: hypothetical protein E2O38_00800 [Pseudomonadota bacterium]
MEPRVEPVMRVVSVPVAESVVVAGMVAVALVMGIGWTGLAAPPVCTFMESSKLIEKYAS